MERMTPAATASRLIVGLAGPELAEAERIWLRRRRPAGVILFRRNVRSCEGLVRLCEAIRAELGDDCEIVADHEGGSVSVLETATGRPPAAYALGRTDDVDLTRRVHAATAALAAAAGVTRILAPCCDVLVEPRNTVIGPRSFGGDPALAARHAAAAVVGLREGGVSACLKHWPGHGGTAVDTHEAAAGDAGRLYEDAFDAAAASGADALMLAHLPTRPGADPAGLDPETVESLRRSRPGLDLWSDDLTMAAVRPVLARRSGEEVGGEGLIDPGDVPESWLIVAAEAGCDRLLLRGIPWTALPLDDGLRGPSPDVEPDPVPADVPSPTAWTEARRRGAEGWTPPSGRGAWIDRTRRQRWATLELAGTSLARRVSPVEIDAERLPRGCGWILVTSHAPLGPDDLGALATLVRDVSSPRLVLALGHPALADGLRAALGSSFTIHAGYDASPDELAAWFGSEEIRSPC